MINYKSKKVKVKSLIPEPNHFFLFTYFKEFASDIVDFWRSKCPPPTAKQQLEAVGVPQPFPVGFAVGGGHLDPPKSTISGPRPETGDKDKSWSSHLAAPEMPKPATAGGARRAPLARTGLGH